jgi:hypothetical protein
VTGRPPYYAPKFDSLNRMYHRKSVDPDTLKPDRSCVTAKGLLSELRADGRPLFHNLRMARHPGLIWERAARAAIERHRDGFCSVRVAHYPGVIRKLHAIPKPFGLPRCIWHNVSFRKPGLSTTT